MKIAVIGGGPSREAEVSRMSSEQVIQGLSPNNEAKYFEYDENLHVQLIEYSPDVVFPVMHGVPGEDGSLQGYLEVLGLPFVGSDHAASAKAIDKNAAKCIWREYNMPVLPSQVLDRESFSPSNVIEIEKCLGSKLAIKPCAQGSALGVQLLPEGGEIEKAIESAFEFDDQLLIEPYISGREITVAVLEQDTTGCAALPIIEIEVTSRSEWYDYTNRYTPGKSKHIIDPSLSPRVANELQEVAVLAHQTLGCRDLSRSDFILTESNQVWLLEINTIPGMTKTSLFPDAAKAQGIEFPTLLDGLARRAYNRANTTNSN